MYLTADDAFESLLPWKLVFVELTEVTEDVWYWGGGGGSLVGKSGGRWTIFIGFNFVIVVVDDVTVWLDLWAEGAIASFWMFFVIVIRFFGESGFADGDKHAELIPGGYKIYNWFNSINVEY